MRSHAARYGIRSINEIDVFTVQDAYCNPQEPMRSMTFSQYGITDFDVPSWNGSALVNVPNGNVTGNDKVWGRFTFATVTTTAVRVNVRGSLAVELQ